ncbi:MAG: glycoside hydrolase family 3 N-terminal domain-containing protein [Bacillota bacterium]|nr:glycoside hydrolase family 3 N-terminal domain-containing protein [Bacillota bacterium]
MRQNRHRQKKKKGIRLFRVLGIILIMCLCLALIFFGVKHFVGEFGAAETPKVTENQNADSVNESGNGQGNESRVQKTREEIRAEEILARMTTWEKVCQMFIISPENLIPYNSVTEAGPVTEQAINDYPVGGIMYSKPNFVSEEQVGTLVNNTQSFSKLGIFVAVDEEGGNVSRLMSTFGGTEMKPMYNYKDSGAETAESNAYTIGQYIAGYGFNVDFAPVADVWSNPENKVIGTRAYSDSCEQAAELIPGAVNGFHKAGIICSLKHFPGHGNTSEDSHSSAAYVNKSKETLAAEDWLPFKAGIDADADMVMVGHLTVPEIDSVPATVSKTIITDILRGELGFSGVVITDSLKMEAVNSKYAPDELCIKCIGAGVDILLDPKDFRNTAKGVLTAVERGEISEERLNESVLRILKLKLKYGIIE